MKEIPLTRGFVAKVDGQDFEWLSQWKWQASSALYAKRTIYLGNGRFFTLFMHSLILRTCTV